jgi:ribose-phosphate pyrophosphokinase
MGEKVNITRFPDGQINVSLNELSGSINHRINSYEDLFALCSIAEIYKSQDVKLSVFIPCLFGQRSDRRFAEYESFGLKVITDIINSCNFSRVLLFDPHSDVGPALINGSEIYDDMYNMIINSVINHRIKDKDLVLVSPDAGAYKKIFKIAEKFNLELVAANKYRDKKGNITMNFSGNVEGKNCLIIDDICEYGNTFMKLTDLLKENGASKVNIYVSHFLGGRGDDYIETVERLTKKVDHIFTTNSVRDFSGENVSVFPIFRNET